MRRKVVLGVFVWVFVTLMGLAFAQQPSGKAPKAPETSGMGHRGGMMQQMSGMMQQMSGMMQQMSGMMRSGDMSPDQMEQMRKIMEGMAEVTDTCSTLMSGMNDSGMMGRGMMGAGMMGRKEMQQMSQMMEQMSQLQKQMTEMMDKTSN